MSKIKILLWDIDGTILNFLMAERAGIKKGFARLGLGECTDEMVDVYSEINKRCWERLEKGGIDKKEALRQRFVEFFGIYGIDKSYVDTFGQHYQVDLGDTICFNDNAFDLLTDLKITHKQYGVTNGTIVAQTRKVKVSGLGDIFEDCFISDDLGVDKPDIRYFDEVLRRIRADLGDFSLDEVMIIGDSLSSDITGGNNAGIKTCWYNPEGLPAPTNLRIDYSIKNLNEIREILS